MPRTFRVEGGTRGFAERLARLNQPPARAHTPAALPKPDADHYRRLAETKRREADALTRDIRTDVDDVSNRFVQRRVAELRDEAGRYDALASEATQ